MSEPIVARYRLDIAYDGAAFHGWQKQKNVRTVCGVMTEAMQRLLRQPIELVGASRTDSGVHARGQVAHFEAACPIPEQRLAHAINSRLPADVEVTEAGRAPLGFHAIKSAAAKGYRYRFFHSRHRPLEKRFHVHHVPYELDTDAMADAARRFEGRHDFAAFASSGHGRASTVRSIHRCTLEMDPPELHLLAEGDGFLYNQVRIMAGTLLAVGRGQRRPEDVDVALAGADRQLAGATLSPEGLWLEWIRHEPKQVAGDREQGTGDRGQETERQQGKEAPCR